MNNIRFLKIVIVLLLLVNISTLAFIWMQNKNTHPPHGPGDFLIKELNFTNDQKQQFETLRNQHRQGMIGLQVQSRNLHKRFFNLLSTTDSLTVALIADSISQNQKQTELFTFNHFKMVRAICNDAQKKKFDTIIEEALFMMSPKPAMDGPPPPEK